MDDPEKETSFTPRCCGSSLGNAAVRATARCTAHHFYSMKIPQDVRSFAAQQGIAEAGRSRARPEFAKNRVPPARLIWTGRLFMSRSAMRKTRAEIGQREGGERCA